MHRTHKIRLNPTCKQRKYFASASGTHRFVFNWALAEWNRQYEAGEKPNGNKLLVQFNALYPEIFPWIGGVHRDCHSQPFADIQIAFDHFFAKRGRKPNFKSRNKDRRSFYIANDRLDLNGKIVRLPRIGKVRMREALRFTGKINSARVVEDCGEWYICISVDVGVIEKPRAGNGVVGIDLGIKTLATLSTGEKIENAKSISDASFGKFRSLLTYKAEQYGTQIIVADQFYPSSKTCSSCGRHANGRGRSGNY